MNGTHPSAYFGGSWERIENRFLLACSSNYSAGTTGGASKHSHHYRIGYGAWYSGLCGTDPQLIQIYDYDTKKWVNGSRDSGIKVDATENAALTNKRATQAGQTYSTYGATETINLLPPYIAVYVWKRTA